MHSHLGTVGHSPHASAMDVMRPSDLLATRPTTHLRDPRRWLRMTLIALGAATLAILLSAVGG
jgi:hypothetical protein